MLFGVSEDALGFGHSPFLGTTPRYSIAGLQSSDIDASSHFYFFVRVLVPDFEQGSFTFLWVSVLGYHR